MNDCPFCHTPNAPSRHFCQNCGRRIVVFCIHCGFANEIEVHYCGGCGKSLIVEDSMKETSQRTKAAPITPESTTGLSPEELSELEKINQRRRQTLTVAGSRKAVSQEDLDKLFGEET